MELPEDLTRSFDKTFSEAIAKFCVDEGLISNARDLESRRFISRSILPHVKKLSDLFNRIDLKQADGLKKYWKESSNPANLRLAYFLYFMPSNAYRIASVWAELLKLGFKFKPENLSALDLGAGSGASPCGFATLANLWPGSLPNGGTWALIEQDKFSLNLGERWLNHYFSVLNEKTGSKCLFWNLKLFHRKIDLTRDILPNSAPRFNLITANYFMNESESDPKIWAQNFLRMIEKHLTDDGIAIILEPALKDQSRRLLGLREALLEMTQKINVLLPCMGNRKCPALASDDWCHEEVTWWRPSYFALIDKMAGLDRKKLAFSYLVLSKNSKTIEELLPKLENSTPNERHRVVSPSYCPKSAESSSRFFECYICGETGKQKISYREKDELQRGDIIIGAKLQGSRLQTLKKIG